MKTTQAQLAHRREIHAKEIAKADAIPVVPGEWGAKEAPSEEIAKADYPTCLVRPRRRGRPPLPLDQRTRKRNYSIRLNPEHIAELQRRGTKALEAWLDLTTVKAA